jgi:hypothetical protein
MLVPNKKESATAIVSCGGDAARLEREGFVEVETNRFKLFNPIVLGAAVDMVISRLTGSGMSQHEVSTAALESREEVVQVTFGDVLHEFARPDKVEFVSGEIDSLGIIVYHMPLRNNAVALRLNAAVHASHPAPELLEKPQRMTLTAAHVEHGAELKAFVGP